MHAAARRPDPEAAARQGSSPVDGDATVVRDGNRRDKRPDTAGTFGRDGIAVGEDAWRSREDRENSGRIVGEERDGEPAQGKRRIPRRPAQLSEGRERAERRGVDNNGPHPQDSRGKLHKRSERGGGRRGREQRRRILSARLHNRAENRDRRQRRESDPHGTLPSLGKAPDRRTPAIPPDGQTHRLRPRSADHRKHLHDVADIRVVRPRRELRSHDHGVSTGRPLADFAESITPTGSRAGFRRLGSRLERSDDGVPVHTPATDRDAQRDPVGGAILPRPASGNVPRWPVKRPATSTGQLPPTRRRALPAPADSPRGGFPPIGQYSP